VKSTESALLISLSFGTDLSEFSCFNSCCMVQ
jgi:hypothetical protein